ncbi:MAG TPA: type 4a pilus biogenesis protein PilO [Isosphaeraceae bacterium]|jgi:Tfp pilus assembly protein PilO|nr:type 4a pilus biogenesis protein PilO [Isosphaeraceae bacterium]
MQGERVSRLAADIQRRLHNPLQLRAFIVVALLAGWYLAAYAPIAAEIDRAGRERAHDDQHLSLARDVERLRGEIAKYKRRLPKSADPNDCVQYVLGGIRKTSLKLNRFEPQPLRKHGPFAVLPIRMELLGAYPDMDALLAWIETNEHIFRVDSVSVQPHLGGHGILVMQMTLLGVLG